MKPKKFTKPGVLAWFEQQPAGSVVGQACSIKACPLATCLNSMTKKTARVTPEWIGFGIVGGPGFKTPRWAIKFMAHADRIGRRSIVREEALTIMENL